MGQCSEDAGSDGLTLNRRRADRISETRGKEINLLIGLCEKGWQI